MSAAKNKSFKSSAKFESRIELPGSFRKLLSGKNMGSTSLNEVMEVMVRLRRKASVHHFIKGIGTGKDKPIIQAGMPAQAWVFL